MSASRRGEISVASVLNAPPDEVWERVMTAEGINYELRPLMRMTIPSGLADGLDPAQVPIGETIGRSWVLLFGVLPFDYDDLKLTRIDPGRGFLEQGNLLSQRAWEHERTLLPAAQENGEAACLLTDRVAWEPRLGFPGRPLQPLFRGIFRHRHRRLRDHFGGRPA